MNTDELSESMWQLLFGVRRSIRYHDKCVAKYEAFHRGTAGISLFFSSAAIVSLLTSVPSGQWIAMAAAGTVAIASTADLVIGFSARARLHSDLKRRHIALESAIISSPDDECLSAHTTARLAIEADEPPVSRKLDIACHEELMRALGLEREKTTA